MRRKPRRADITALGGSVQSQNNADASTSGLANPQTEAKESHVLPDILNSQFQPKSSFSLMLRRWYFYSALLLSISEIRTLGLRIRRVLEIRRAEMLRGDEKVRAWMDGCAVTGPGTRDYIIYMQRTAEDNPSLSIYDRLLLTEAWKAGWESGARKDTARNQSGTANQ